MMFYEFLCFASWNKVLDVSYNVFHFSEEFQKREEKLTQHNTPLTSMLSEHHQNTNSNCKYTIICCGLATILHMSRCFQHL